MIALCETVTAGPLTPMHLRITDRLRTGGGADTTALCGREVAWDVREAEARDLPAPGHTCAACSAAALRLGYHS